MNKNISAVLFCCDHNSIRSPMGEGLMKAYVGTSIFVQSAGVMNDKEIDGFAIAVCHEVNVELIKHKVRSFADLENWGDDLDSYDLIIALSEKSAKIAYYHTQNAATEVEYWPIPDPTIVSGNRDNRLQAYRHIRDLLIKCIEKKFTPS